jgi:hypothetical protein
MSSTIPSSLPGVSAFNAPAPAEAPAAAEAPKTQNYTPLWLVESGGTGTSFQMLGIRLPNANGDLAALLAEVSLTLEQNVEENQTNRAKASLASLAGALSGFARETLQAELTRKTQALADTKATQADFKARTQGPLASQAAKTEEIAGLRQDIAGTEEALENPDLSDDERTALEDQLDGYRTALADAYSSREAVDVSLAESRIVTLGREVDDLQAQFDRAPAGSGEATTIGTQLASKKSELQDARSDLDGFRNGAKTEAARDAFSAKVRSDVSGTGTDLQAAADAHQAGVNATQSAVQGLASLTLLVAASAQSQFAADRNDDDTVDGLRDQGIEKAFEQIVEGLDDAAARLAERLNRTADTDAARSDRSVAGKALGLLASVADLLAVLDGQSASPKAPMPVPPDTVANRIRVGV